MESRRSARATPRRNCHEGDRYEMACDREPWSATRERGHRRGGHRPRRASDRSVGGSPASVMVSGRRCETMRLSPHLRRLPKISTATSAESPEITCTTVPPAKSMAPIPRRQPPSAQLEPSERRGRSQWCLLERERGACRALHAFRTDSGKQRRRDDREHRLDHHGGLMRYRRRGDRGSLPTPARLAWRVALRVPRDGGRAIRG